MPHSAAARLRRLWLDVHLWLGVGLLVVLAPLSLSGAVLVWHDALDHGLHAERYAVSGPDADRPLSAYAAAAQGAFGQRARLSQVRLPFQPGDPVVAVGQMAGPAQMGGRPPSLNAWIDPPTAKVLASADLMRGATMVIHRFHGSLLIPGVGRKIVGWLGWAMFVSAATGLWLWWPRHGGFLKGLRWRRGASQLFNLHHMIGFWISLPLAILSLTGVYISFPQTSHALVGAPAPVQRPPGRGDPRLMAPPLAAPRLTIDEAAAAALAARPGARIQSVDLPKAGGRPVWRVALAGGGELEIDDRTGDARPAHAAPTGRRPDPVSQWMRGVHDGSKLGLAWRLAITVVGAAPPVLAVTGVVMWLRRRKRRLMLRQA